MPRKSIAALVSLPYASRDPTIFIYFFYLPFPKGNLSRLITILHRTPVSVVTIIIYTRLIEKRMAREKKKKGNKAYLNRGSRFVTREITTSNRAEIIVN